MHTKGRHKGWGVRAPRAERAPCAGRLCLAFHPQAQARVAAELQAAGLLAGADSQPRLLEWADLSSLEYLDAVRSCCTP